MTLTRGESGDNAVGPQLFEGLALIRTDELLTADKYYGVDQQYFTTMIDYGFSKRLEETTDKWGLENAFRDVVRVVRMTRPWVIISRFQGNTRDGHGNHQAAGLLSQQAAEAAGDPKKFPEQIAEGLRPWTPLKVYMGGVRVNEPWTIGIQRRVQPVAWRFVRQHRELRPELPAIAEQRAVQSSVGPNLDTTCAASRDRARQGDVHLTASMRPTQACSRRSAGRRPQAVDATLSAIDAAAKPRPPFRSPTVNRRDGSGRGLKLTREVIAKSGSESDRPVRPEDQGAAVSEAISASLGLSLTAWHRRRRRHSRAAEADAAGRSRPRRRCRQSRPDLRRVRVAGESAPCPSSLPTAARASNFARRRVTA
jgi:LmbE family N-acetylglucosaminyl deacetylase